MRILDVAIELGVAATKLRAARARLDATDPAIAIEAVRLDRVAAQLDELADDARTTALRLGPLDIDPTPSFAPAGALS